MTLEAPQEKPAAPFPVSSLPAFRIPALALRDEGN